MHSSSLLYLHLTGGICWCDPIDRFAGSSQVSWTSLVCLHFCPMSNWITAWNTLYWPDLAGDCCEGCTELSEVLQSTLCRASSASALSMKNHKRESDTKRLTFCISPRCCYQWSCPDPAVAAHRGAPRAANKDQRSHRSSSGHYCWSQDWPQTGKSREMKGLEPAVSRVLSMARHYVQPCTTLACSLQWMLSHWSERKQEVEFWLF